jgi:hypothetical protein
MPVLEVARFQVHRLGDVRPRLRRSCARRARHAAAQPRRPHHPLRAGTSHPQRPSRLRPPAKRIRIFKTNEARPHPRPRRHRPHVLDSLAPYAEPSSPSAATSSPSTPPRRRLQGRRHRLRRPARLLHLPAGQWPKDPLFLQIKEEPLSAYAPYLGRRRDEDPPPGPPRRRRPARHAAPVRPLPRLDHHRGPRLPRPPAQRPQRLPRLDQLKSAGLMEYASVCGELLARGHARSGDPCMHRRLHRHLRALRPGHRPLRRRLRRPDRNHRPLHRRQTLLHPDGHRPRKSPRHPLRRPPRPLHPIHRTHPEQTPSTSSSPEASASAKGSLTSSKPSPRCATRNKHLTIVGSISNEIRPSSTASPPKRHLHRLSPQPELARIMAPATPSSFPASRRASPSCMAQAMASGCPVIATAATGAEDLFTNEIEGFIFPTATPAPSAPKPPPPAPPHTPPRPAARTYRPGSPAPESTPAAATAAPCPETPA